MLCDNLYSLLSLETTQQGCLAQIRLLPESPIYAAHFKGMPVTPGACLVEMATELASRGTGRPLDVAESPDIRFLHPILPGETTEMTVQLEGDPATDLWSVQFSAGETLCARMKLVLKP